MPKYNVEIKVEAQPKDINSWNDIARSAVTNLAVETYTPIFNVNPAGGLISKIDIDSCNVFTSTDLQRELGKLAVSERIPGRILEVVVK